MNEINLMYKSIVRLPYTIHVKLSSVIVSTSGSASQWTEKYRVTSPQWDEVDANSALNDLSNWARTTDLLPAYDHIMLFSGYDLTRSANGGTSDKITGLAYTATLCDTNGKASSIVEDLGGFQCMSTAAHELGHSINYFNNFLTDEVRYNRGRTCLYQSLTANPNVPDVTSEMPENCVFGDQPGIAFSEQDCPTFVDNFPGYCYQEVVRGRCCGSCARWRDFENDDISWHSCGRNHHSCCNNHHNHTNHHHHNHHQTDDNYIKNDHNYHQINYDNKHNNNHSNHYEYAKNYDHNNYQTDYDNKYNNYNQSDDNNNNNYYYYYEYAKNYDHDNRKSIHNHTNPRPNHNNNFKAYNDCS
nr:hypothetical protein BaRGS_024195 [Batillaria attramentaria]